MQKSITHTLAFVLILVFAIYPALATCGGGGGGGGGGTSSSGTSSNVTTPQVYHVPWKVRTQNDPPAMGMILYWFPSSSEELKKSSLRESRTLSLYGSQCISLEVADSKIPGGSKLIGDSKLPLVVLSNPDGTPIDRIENKDGRLKVTDVEKLIETEVKKRESGLDITLKDGRDKAKASDNAGAIQLFRSVLEQKCMFPKKAKEAAKELKKLGVDEVANVPDAPIFDVRESALIERTMVSGLKAELDGRYLAARKFYSQAHRMDPADPTPLRYLGELYRHDTGEWDKARATFQAILRMPSDPLSLAVAQHGLGKMTIHTGDFKKGLALMEASIKTYPLPLTYRNLAVYWNSERDLVKTEQYIQKALALDPEESYNLIFAAAFMAGTGHADEALKIARENKSLIPASYNLAAIYAQAGQREKALSMLKRHFFQYERYQAVRIKEMMEARVDAVFVSLREDPAFLALTRDADGMLPIPITSKGMNK